MMDVTNSDPRIGSILNNRYKIIDRIAAGGMAVVYKGERLELGRPVAIKFLQELMLQNPKFISRFESEARAMSKLSHPYCVSVIDFGVEGAPYIVMDYVEGITLKALIAKERISVSRAITLARQILAGIAHAHSQGIIHRDIKPENIMLQEATGVGEQVRIFDFGLAKLMDTGPGASMTHSSLVAGTPNYMSPEQSRGLKVDERTDLYSICVLFFELLTGRKPFINDDFLEVVRMHRETVPPSLEETATQMSFSTELEALVARGLAKNPDDRFQTAEEFSLALDTTPEGQLAKELEIARPDPKAKTLPVGTTTPFSAEAQEPVAPTQTIDSDEESVPSVPPAPTTPGPSQRSGRFSQFILAVISALAVFIGFTVLFFPETDEPNRSDEIASPPPKEAEPTPTEPKSAPAQEETKPIPESLPPEVELEGTEGIPEAEDETVQDTPDTPPENSTDNELVAHETAIPQPPPVLVKSLNDVKKLLREGKKEAAIGGLQKLRREQPKKAVFVYMLANLYYEKNWLADAYEHYREAIRLENSYKKRGQLIRNLIELMSTEKLGRKAMYLLQKTVGRPALPHLKRAAKKHKSPLVKKRAAALIKKIRGR